jgi:hypothetical protein
VPASDQSAKHDALAHRKVANVGENETENYGTKQVDKDALDPLHGCELYTDASKRR